MKRRNRRLIVLAITFSLIIIAIIALIIVIASLTKTFTSFYQAKLEPLDLLDSKSGYILYNDEQVKVSSKDKFVYLVYDFDEVEKDQILGYVYLNATDEQIEKLNDLNEQIYKYNKSLSYLDLSQKEVENKISSLLAEISHYTEKGQYSIASRLSFLLDIYELRNNLFYSQNDNYKYELLALNNTKKSVLSQTGDGVEVKSLNSGIFIKETDGYEGQINYNKIITIANKPDEYLSTLTKNNDLNVVGRIIDDSEVYYLTKMSINDKERYFKDKDVKISFELYDNEITYTSIVEGIIPSTLYDDIYILLSLEMTEEIPFLPRLTNATVSYKTVSCFKIPKEAVYDIKGNSCVYVLSDGKANLKQIDIINEHGASYYVYGTKDGVYPELLDNETIIITNGKIYDGKKFKTK